MTQEEVANKINTSQAAYALQKIMLILYLQHFYII